MKKLLSILLISLIPAIIFAQEQEYKSKEQDQYYDNTSSFRFFTPLSPDEIRQFKNEYFSYTDITNCTPYSDSLRYTPYQNSIHAIVFNPANLRSNYTPEPEYIGKIKKEKILQHESKSQIEAFIYESIEFEKLSGEYGIWVAYSKDNGLTWEYFYTGIVQRQPLYIKWYSKIPLINSSNELQIEACLLRQLNPGPCPDYEVIKDSLMLTLDVSTLRKDTDGDGLTDIVERKLFTDLYNKDTDGDGITDNLDLNPRYSLPRTDKTVIFESVVDGTVDTNPILLNKEPVIHNVTENTETILIVTDDPNLQSIQPKSTRVIILSQEEYENLKGKFRTDLNKMSITPLFKVDNEADTYIFTRSFNTWGGEYLVKKTEKGWIVEVLMSWIS